MIQPAGSTEVVTNQVVRMHYSLNQCKYLAFSSFVWTVEVYSKAEQRLAAKRAARAEARALRMQELERQQREKSFFDRGPVTGSEIFTRRPTTSSGAASTWDFVTRPPSSKYSSAGSDVYSMRSGRSSALSSRHSVSTSASLYEGSSSRGGGYRDSAYSSARDNDDWDVRSEVSWRGGQGYLKVYKEPAPRTTSAASDIFSWKGARNRPWDAYSSASQIPPVQRWGSAEDLSSRRSDRSSSDSSRRSSYGSLSGSEIYIGSISEDAEGDELGTNDKARRGAGGSVLSFASLSALGGSSSRRGSDDDAGSSSSEASIRELKALQDALFDVEQKYMTDLKVLKDALSESEEKYKKAMVSNAQLDNEKTTLQYQVDILKDKLEIQEESMNELQREYKEKCRELERQKHAYGILEHNVAELKEALRQRDELIEEQGLVLVGTANGEAETGEKKTKVALVTPEAAQMLEQAGEGTLDLKALQAKKQGPVQSQPNTEYAMAMFYDERLKRMAEEKEDLVDQIRRLKLELEEEKERTKALQSKANRTAEANGPDMELLDIQTETGERGKERGLKSGEASKQVNNYKFRLQKAEQDLAAMEGNIQRLEGQVNRYRVAAEGAEKKEDELKTEKRKLERELRKSQDMVQELQESNSSLERRIEKIKSFYQHRGHNVAIGERQSGGAGHDE
ncbi:PREDICTED: leucine-rich repeat flightless-interacting protein 2-like isoform X3 [Branchiostoma belcheri]|uniref:Leucine-rich repeat flightless-interacting protein 2-like isoform X3 n=1 Tax=Branchiostoma belcheri TaxID=7741 RepID=A0A6P4XNW8_BRABE|nr:PREDICTED: leucine-rich repeat flightless-interacting protein 2-like isoform X3 [Branchiostoma belcheri]